MEKRQMDKITLILVLFFFSCREAPITEAKNVKRKKQKETELPVKSRSDSTIYNWMILDTADRKNIYEDTVPIFLESFARKNEFPCPDTLTGCAACGHCAYIKLSDDWKYFAFERQETKHYCKINIYRRTKNWIISVDTLYGTTISSQKINGEKIYRLVLLEDYWKDERPMNIEYYRFENGKFHLTDSIIGRW